MSLQDSGSSEGPASVGISLALGWSEFVLVVSSEVELRVDLSLLKYIIVSIHAGGIESSHVLGFSFSQVSKHGDTIGNILVFFVVSGSVLDEPGCDSVLKAESWIEKLTKIIKRYLKFGIKI